ncbi:hybrid sensor histidine kinase/response regulator [Persicobacter diffluens]|uniref:histidine kinase n=1 Tax=Persicobacter diffluens TaxID=981 RepID=A0AAN4VX18_9BACT|nr:hybrid sensor histidine kinase/response regulator [Persicobacter diffluens]
MQSAQFHAKILIVDDIPKNIQVAANILKQENYNITFAKSGPQALEKIEKIEFDLILLDVMMPEMDGFEVCRRIKEDPKNQGIPVIFLTAKTESESIVKGFEVGGIDYVTKPFNGIELLARVRNHINLRNTQKELEKANATKDRMFSIIGHDLRGPIGNIKSIFSLLTDNQKSFEPKQFKTFLDLGRESAESTFSLLENLLNWARSQRNQIQFNPRKVDVYRLTLEMINLVSLQASHKDIELVNEVEPHAIVYADDEMIKTIIRNLLSNAIKFTDDGGKIMISGQSEGEYFHMAVRDTGQGMTEDVVQQLVEEDGYTTSGTAGEKGSGLGLYLFKKFVKMHGGSFDIQSVPDQGSIFSFKIPLHPPQKTK